MIRRTRHIKALLFLATVALCAVSCHTDEYREICNYKVQLRYDYNEENGTIENMIEYYVSHIDEYIFDEAGILFQSRRFTADRCTEHMNSELDLPPGRYSVIAVGNRDERSEIFDQARASGEMIPGVTRRGDVRMTLDNCPAMPGNTNGECERLYHGYRTFTVKERGISRIRVDMINAHLRLKFRVTWKNGSQPPRGGNYYALLETIPSEYELMPEFIYPAGSFDCRAHDPGSDDLYPSSCNNVIHHIPWVMQDRNDLDHRVDTYINADNEMWGEYTTYRIKNVTDPVLSLYSEDGTQIMRRVDLGGYFDHYAIDLDTTLKQDYEIAIEIDGDRITLSPLVSIADWEEGGLIGS